MNMHINNKVTARDQEPVQAFRNPSASVLVSVPGFGSTKM